MQILEGQLLVSATDLIGHLECAHLTTLELGAAEGQWPRPVLHDPELDLLQKKGIEHESRCLERFAAEGKDVISLNAPPAASIAELQASAARTTEAMRAGVQVIHQATLFDGRWRGHPDFLLRVERPSNFGLWSYEPGDAKLAQRVRAAALLQLCMYADQLAHLQGLAPERIGVATRDGTLKWHRTTDFATYYRTVKAGLEQRLFGELPRPETYPDPVDHCRVCRWYGECADRRRDDDHLCRVASITRSQTRRLQAAGVRTLGSLAALPKGARIPDLSAQTLDRLHRQARLQQERYADGRIRYELIRPDPQEPLRGLARLPERTPEDIFLDFESDPWIGDGGCEYLMGFVIEQEGRPQYRALWSHSPGDEKRSLETLIDFVTEWRRIQPRLHVYHYGPYEATALKRLVCRHATREDELDQLLRGGALVDLYAVVRQGLRVSEESYSLKKVEKLYMPERHGPVTRPGFAVVEYERWLETNDAAILDGIAAYNRDDCISVWMMRPWLEARRLEAEAAFRIELGRPAPVDGVPGEEAVRQLVETRSRIERLTDGVPAAKGDRTDEQHACWLLAQLLDWHRREAKPEWWRFFDLLARPMEELVTSPEALGDLQYQEAVGAVGRSLVHRYAHEIEQEHKFQIGDKPINPATETPAGEVVAIDRAAGTIDLKRAKSSQAPHPRALIPAKPIPATAQRDALRRIADYVISNGVEGPGPYRALRDLLLRRQPRVRGLAPGQPLVGEHEEALCAARRLALSLEDSYLPVQGPPGSGKTFTAARMILALLAAGKRVGITATAHKAITNLVDEVCRAARADGRIVRVIQKAEGGDASGEPEVTPTEENAEVILGLSKGQYEVAAGTPWLFARDDMEGLVDVLFVDEAGQMSLANVVAMGGAGQSIVLLGDPNQLPQVTKGTHPHGAGVSALEHVLGGMDTIAHEQGVFLDQTWRMHRDVCTYVSDAFYEGRLEPHPTTQVQTVEAADGIAGTGLRLLQVAHERNGSRSPEEAGRVVDAVAALLDQPWINQRGERKTLTLSDILIVAPYNLQVAEISRQLQGRFGPGARVGTVDKFQGQEGAVAVYSTATSSPDDAPRDIEFLYSRNRLNVAVSRARALAVIVCSPQLFRIRCRTPDEMRMANAFCMLLERAGGT